MIKWLRYWLIRGPLENLKPFEIGMKWSKLVTLDILQIEDFQNDDLDFSSSNE